ncbi:MAG TPA: PEP-utilizing enzyme [Acidimicrobiales bacterium]|nr:PEP-utilizing enzyme [Acidimicrobiales bacterium]
MSEWTPPAPGPWQQDQAHMPEAMSPVMQELYPAGFNRGFTETFSRYGVLLDRLAMASVNGFTYHQPQPFDLPGPDGPMTPDEIGAEIGRRTQVAAESFEKKRWREDLLDWDTVRKPASIARHRELGDVDLARLDEAQLAEHLLACRSHVQDMTYQHHRYNMAAMLPVGDFLLAASGLLQRPPTALLGVFDGCSPVSAVVSPEIATAVEGVSEDAGARALVVGDGDPAERLAALRERVPAVDDYVRTVRMRLIEGFDVLNPTLGEMPEILLGRLAAALDADPAEARRRADSFVESLRAELSGEALQQFDELLDEARLVYRLRDERGLYSDISAVGLLRLALLEVGHRLHAQGRLHDPEHVLDATFDLAVGVLADPRPVADELGAAAAARQAATAAGAPRHLGDPPPPRPPLEQLPPPLARVMAAVGFLIEGILGQLEEPAGTGATVVGIPASAGVAEGRARLVRDAADLITLEPGDVLVARATGEACNSILHLLSGIVTDHGSFACHAGIVAREMGFPAVVGTVNGTERISDGDRVRVDGTTGEVTILG